MSLLIPSTAWLGFELYLMSDTLFAINVLNLTFSLAKYLKTVVLSDQIFSAILVFPFS